MTTLAVVLKDEIRRLARKEIRAQTGRTSKAVAQYRREIARLKREQRAQEKRIARLVEQLREGTSIAAATTSTSINGENRFSARSVRAQRRRTGLSAADYAKLIGVSPLTIYNWEHNKSRPRQGQFSALVALRGLGKREAQIKLSEMNTPKSAPAKTGRRGRPRKPK